MSTIRINTKRLLGAALVLIICAAGTAPSAEATDLKRKSAPTSTGPRTTSSPGSFTPPQAGPQERGPKKSRTVPDDTIDLDEHFLERQSNNKPNDSLGGADTLSGLDLGTPPDRQETDPASDTLDGDPNDSWQQQETQEAIAAAETRDDIPTHENIEEELHRFVLKTQVDKSLQNHTTVFTLDDRTYQLGLIITVQDTDSFGNSRDLNAMIAAPPIGFVVRKVAAVPGTTTVVVVYEHSVTRQKFVFAFDTSFNNQMDPNKDPFFGKFTKQELLNRTNLVYDWARMTPYSVVSAHGPNPRTMQVIAGIIGTLPEKTLVTSCNGHSCGTPKNVESLARYFPRQSFVGVNPQLESLTLQYFEDLRYGGISVVDIRNPINVLPDSFVTVEYDPATQQFKHVGMTDQSFSESTGFPVIK